MYVQQIIPVGRLVAGIAPSAGEESFAGVASNARVVVQAWVSRAMLTSHMNATANSSQPSSNPTPGWRTSEFWMTALGHLGLILAAASGALPSKYAAIAAAVSQVAYNLSRGLTKAGSGSAY